MNTSSDTSTQREGLPASYQMRADAHYVDLLDHAESGPTLRFLPPTRFSGEARADVTAAFVESVRAHGILQPLIVRREGGDYRLIDGRKRLAAALATGTSAIPCLVHQVDAETAAALEEALRVNPAAAAPADQALDGSADPSSSATDRGTHALLRSLGQLNSCSALLDSADITQRTLIDIVRIEAARSWCLAMVLPVMAGTQAREFPAAPYPVKRLVDRVTSLCEHERRLRAVVLDSKLAVREATQIVVNADVAVAALGGLVLAAFEAYADRPGVRVDIAAASRGADGCTVSIAAPGQIRPAEASPFASAMIAAVAAAADIHGARLTMLPREGVTTYSVNFPLAL